MKDSGNIFGSYFLNSHNERYVIPYADILYLNASEQYCYIITKVKTFYVSRNLNYIEEALNAACFFRSHKSYLVNLQHVVHLKKKKTDDKYVFFLIMKNGDAIPCSRRAQPKFQKASEQFFKALQAAQAFQSDAP